MKRFSFHIIATLALFMAWSGIASAQQRPFTRVAPDQQSVTVGMATIKVTGPGPWLDVRAYALTLHSLQFTYITAPSGITVTFECSIDGATAVSTIGTSTSIAGATITAAAATTCGYVRANISGLTGTFEMVPTYFGSTAAAGAASSVTVSSGTITTITNPVTVTDGAGALNVICDSGCSGGTQYTQDAALTVATSVGGMAMGRASAAAPTNVSADNDAVMPWYLRSGAVVTQPAFAGVLASTGNGTTDSGTARVTLSSDSTGAVAGTKTNNNAAPGATNVGVLAGVATAAAPSSTEGNMVALSLDLAGALRVSGGGGGTQYTQDAALTVGSTLGNMAMGRASAAVPTDVSADNDAVIPWYLRSGAVAGQPTFGGVLAVAGNGASGTGVQRVTIANDSTGILAGVTTVTTLTGTTTLTPGTGATNLGKAVDNVVGATDTGVLALAMRKDTPATITPADGDYTQLRTDSLGRLWVDCGTGCSGGTQYNIDVAAGGSDTGTIAIAMRKDTPATITPADGDWTQLRVNSLGALYTAPTTADAAENAAVATNPVPIGGVYRSSPVTLDAGDVGYPLLDVNGRLIVNCNTGCSGGAQYVQDAALTVATTSVTIAGGRASAAAPTDVSADNDAVMAWMLKSGALVTQPSYAGVLATTGNGASGTGVARVTIANDSTGILAGVTTVSTVTNLSQMNGAALLMGNGVTGTGSQRVTIASDNTAFSVNATLSAETTKVIGTARIIGNAGATMDSAPRATVPTNGFQDFGVATNAEQTAATNGQAQSRALDLVGKTITLPYSNPENFVSGGTAAMTGTTSTSVIASAGGSLRNYITGCTFSNSHATVGTEILLQDGSGGTTLWEAPAAAVFGGSTIVFPTPLKTTAATALFTANVTTGANTFVFCTGYKGL